MQLESVLGLNSPSAKTGTSCCDVEAVFGMHGLKVSAGVAAPLVAAPH
jgi:hypothetical protein